MSLIQSRSTTSVIGGLLMTVACGCNSAPDDRARGPAPAPGAMVIPPERQTSPVTREDVLERRPGPGPFDASDYAAWDVTFRLYGVELGDGTRPRTAVLADTSDWSTRTYDEGALVGRGMRIVQIAEDGVTFEHAPSAHGARSSLAPGAELRVRLVRHRLGRVVRPLGRHRYVLDPVAARAAHEEGGALPTAEEVQIFGMPALRLGRVAEGSLLGEVGFREGDLVLGLDEAPADPTTLERLASALTGDRRSVEVPIVRNGVVMTRTYVNGARSQASRP